MEETKTKEKNIPKKTKIEAELPKFKFYYPKWEVPLTCNTKR